MHLDAGGMEDGILRGLEKGRREGRREGRQEGSVGALTVDDLDRLTDALFDFSSRIDLEIWLATERR